MTTTPAARDERELFESAYLKEYFYPAERWSLVPEKYRTEHADISWRAWQARAALAESELAEVRALSVTNIMLAVVPGADGMGEEVYAKSIDDVLQAFTKVEDRADKFQAECEELATEVADRLRRTLALQKERDELRAELERVKASQVLDAPAQVGNVRFSKGINWITVIGAAQRYAKFMSEPEQEAARLSRYADAIRKIYDFDTCIVCGSKHGGLPCPNMGATAIGAGEGEAG